MRNVSVAAAMALVGFAAYAENWPQWRGPELNGVSHEKNLPVRWTREENVAWKLAMPSWSGATPIIWGERIFLNVADKDDLYLWCVDRAQGVVLWKKHVAGGNFKINKQNMSSPSPVTDGTSIYVMTGNGIFKGFDFSGNELWARDIQKDYGRFGLNWGYASSPLLFEDALYVQVLHGMKTRDPSYLLRIDKKTGKTVWRVERPTEAVHESPDAYTTPALLRYDGKVEIVVSGGDCVTGHDPATGKELWRGNGFNPQKDGAYRVIASPVVENGVVYAPTRVRPLQAFRAGGRGDVTETHRLWAFQNGPDVPTPVTDGTYFYVVNDRGIVWCLDAKTGKEIWGPQRIKHGIYSASPVLADGKIYITNEDGVTTVFRAGPKFELLAENNMDDYTLSSIAISDGQIFLRTAQFLYCIGKRAGR
ncbi:MAG TPA: PQQ-binding-like beta-propeller repeat protein [Bryobacteraceae bacterium]|nr:PQQ-binding-like beta-propeller repeat protein [Bryobacteraceae bacterium]